jgi:chaperonin GroEL (HSP60 family)
VLCCGHSRLLLCSLCAGGANTHLGIDGNKGVIADMTALGIFDPFAVRTQVLKSAIEAACMLLRIDDILSGQKNKKFGDEDGSKKPAEEQEENQGGPMGAD